MNHAPSGTIPGNDNNADLAGTSAARFLQKGAGTMTNRGLLDEEAAEIRGECSIESYDDGGTNKAG